jgi:hypothetical protein
MARRPRMTATIIPFPDLGERFDRARREDLMREAREAAEARARRRPTLGELLGDVPPDFDGAA